MLTEGTKSWALQFSKYFASWWNNHRTLLSGSQSEPLATKGVPIADV